MFYVWDFSAGAEEYECLGAFSKEDEAKALCDQRRLEWLARGNVETESNKCHCVYSEMSWDYFCARIVTAHLRALAEPLARLTEDPRLALIFEGNGRHTKDSPLVDIRLPEL